MNSAAPTTLGVDEIVEGVCVGVAARRGIVVEPGCTAAAAVRAALRVSDLRTQEFADGAEYSLEDFLVSSDQDFIDAAYRALLQRRADPGGAQHYLAALRSGSMDRAQVLGRLRYSAETAAAASPSRGCSWHSSWRSCCACQVSTGLLPRAGRASHPGASPDHAAGRAA
jgi:hypothetical protein